MKNYKCYLVDYDGTIIDSMEMWRNVSKSYIESKGYSATEKLISDIKYLSSYDTAVYLKENLNMPESVSDILMDINNFIVKEYPKKPLKDGAMKLLHHLRESKAKVILFSATPEFLLRSSMEALHIDYYFDKVYSASDMMLRKEDGSGHKFILRQEKLKKKDVLIIEDSTKVYRLAKELGIDILMISDYSNINKQSQYDCKFWNLMDIDQFFEGE